MTAEDTNIPQPANNNPLEDGGELLQAIEGQIESSQVVEQVENTTVAVVRGLLPWKYFIPSDEVASLIKKREAANDNIPQAISNDRPKKAA